MRFSFCLFLGSLGLSVTSLAHARTLNPLAANETSSEVKELRLVIHGKSDFTLGKKTFSSFADLREELHFLGKSEQHVTLVIVSPDEADAAITAKVLKECRKAGISSVRVEGT